MIVQKNFRSKIVGAFYLLVVWASLGASYCLAQAFRYMDESGNIHFVDSISEVPPRYRNQVLAPTPAPTGKARRTPKPKPTKKPKAVKTAKPKKTLRAKKGEFFPQAPPGQFPAPPPVTPAPVLAPRVPESSGGAPTNPDGSASGSSSSLSEIASGLKP